MDTLYIDLYRVCSYFCIDCSSTIKNSSRLLIFDFNKLKCKINFYKLILICTI
nr:MAG TPA: hypothetical protein [Caudoviricetes sp.]